MGAVDAKTARGMAQKIQRVTPGINYIFIDQHPLLKIAKRKGNIKYRGSHTEYEWFIYKDAVTAPTWGGGELSVNTFEEQDPATRAHLPYCWLQQNYGVSDRTMEANRHSPDKVFKPLGANLKLAQIKMYEVIGPSLYTGSGGDGGNEPVGLKYTFGNAYESGGTTGVPNVAAASSYANKALNVGAISTYAVAKANYISPQWAPEVCSLHNIPNVASGTAANATWSTDCLIALTYMEEEMAITADLTGTGESQKPDIALMQRDPFHALTALITPYQAQYGVPAQLVDEDLRLAGWRNIVVGGLTCIKDNDVPDDSVPYERVIIIDSNQFIIKTTHTKAEGLIRNEFDADNVMVNGVIGKLSANIGFYVKSPTAVGCILGCHD